MSGPAKFGAIVYAGNIQKLSTFYLEMFGLRILHETDGLVSLGGQCFNIVVHAPPVELPERNFNTIKMFLTVDDLEEAKRQAVELGGEALEGEWSNPIFKVCNIADPEGNHIQLREFKL